jgi:AraC-like DNA-binding protein
VPKPKEPFRDMRHLRAPGLGGAELSYVHTSSGAAPPDVRSLLEVVLVDHADKVIAHRGKQQRIRSGLVCLRSAYEAGRLVRRHASETRVRILAIPPGELGAAFETLRIPSDRMAPVLTYFDDRELRAATAGVFVAVEAREPASTVEMRLADCTLQIARRLAPRMRVDDGPVDIRSANRIREVLRDRLADDLRLADLAREVRLSRTYVVHSFKRAFGLPPGEYLMQLRVARARELLAAGQRPVDVAYACGFCDQSHLNRWFRLAVGLTPGDYGASADMARGRRSQ